MVKGEGTRSSEDIQGGFDDHPLKLNYGGGRGHILFPKIEDITQNEHRGVKGMGLPSLSNDTGAKTDCFKASF